MSHDQHNHDNHHEQNHGHEKGGYHATVKGYVVGFILAVVLTAIPFWLVMGKVFPSSGTTAAVVLVFGAVQMVVHMVYFLHMNAKVEGGWPMLAMIFTIGLVVIMMAGSVWVMYHMNTNMMPHLDSQTARNMP